MIDEGIKCEYINGRETRIENMRGGYVGPNNRA